MSFTENDTARFNLGRKVSSTPNLARKKVTVQQVQHDKRFTERPQYAIHDGFEYSRSGEEPGVILIFNQLYCQNDKPRNGSRRDVMELIHTLQRQGYNISEENVCYDFTKEQVLNKLEQVAENEELLTKANCFMLFFMTHGDENEFIKVYDGTIRTLDLWKKFANHPSLVDKPKLFVIQACKGDSHSTVDGSPAIFANGDSEIVDVGKISAQLSPDMLVVYCTLEGNKGFRHPIEGSWFIQELCKNIHSYGRRDDVVSIVTRVIKCVSVNYYSVSENDEIQKQMPLFVSTLKRKFYLNTNKDRAVLLKIQKTTEDISKEIKEIREILVKLTSQKILK